MTTATGTVYRRSYDGTFAVGTKRHPLPIFERYEVDPDTNCWLWLGYLDPKGYGRCKPVGSQRTVMAYRVMYEHHIGAIPAGLTLDHLCRTPRCVNPAHLEPVTRRENTRRGAAAKLTPSQVLEIRAEVDRLCEKHGVRPRTLSAIGERQIWKDI